VKQFEILELIQDIRNKMMQPLTVITLLVPIIIKKDMDELDRLLELAESAEGEMQKIVLALRKIEIIVKKRKSS